MCGTVHVKTGGIPAEMKTSLSRGDVCLVSKDNCMVTLKWADTRQVPMLSTMHDDAMITKARRTQYVEGGP